MVVMVDWVLLLLLLLLVVVLLLLRVGVEVGLLLVGILVVLGGLQDGLMLCRQVVEHRWRLLDRRATLVAETDGVDGRDGGDAVRDERRAKLTLAGEGAVVLAVVGIKLVARATGGRIPRLHAASMCPARLYSLHRVQFGSSIDVRLVCVRRLAFHGKLGVGLAAHLV